jgi:hypothetical protein
MSASSMGASGENRPTTDVAEVSFRSKHGAMTAAIIPSSDAARLFAGDETAGHGGEGQGFVLRAHQGEGSARLGGGR